LKSSRKKWCEVDDDVDKDDDDSNDIESDADSVDGDNGRFEGNIEHQIPFPAHVGGSSRRPASNILGYSAVLTFLAELTFLPNYSANSAYQHNTSMLLFIIFPIYYF
jgi:hypothetical protein